MQGFARSFKPRLLKWVKRTSFINGSFVDVVSCRGRKTSNFKFGA